MAKRRRKKATKRAGSAVTSSPAPTPARPPRSRDAQDKDYRLDVAARTMKKVLAERRAADPNEDHGYVEDLLPQTLEEKAKQRATKKPS